MKQFFKYYEPCKRGFMLLFGDTIKKLDPIRFYAP